MKIALISSGFLPVTDGVTIAVYHRLQHLDRLGHKTLLFCPDYRPLASLYPDWRDYTGDLFPNVRVVNLSSTPFLDLDFERNVSQKSYHVLREELEKFQPDIIHVDEPERLWLGFFKRAGLDYARQKNIPCVSFFHTNFIEYIEDYLPLPRFGIKIVQWLMKHHRNWIYNGYDATLVSSLSTARKVSRIGFKKVIKTELLGVDYQRYKIELREENYFEREYKILGINHKIKIIFLGRLTPEKGWKFILDSLLDRTHPIDFTNLAFILAGEGFLQGEIVEKLQRLTPDVYCLGRVIPDKIPALLINGDMYITASETETKGLTILEAQAAGLPVLAPRSNGIIDSIEEGKNGLLFQPQNTRDFLEKFYFLWENPEERKSLGASARESVILYDWEPAIERLVEIWEKAIEKNLPSFS